MRIRVVLLLSASAGLLSCADSAVGPADEVSLQLVGFQTPTAVSASDTLRVSVQAVVGCGVVPGTDLRLERGRVSIRAWATRADLERICIAILPATARIDLAIPPQYLGAASTVLVFQQPRGADSVRVVPSMAFAALRSNTKLCSGW